MSLIRLGAATGDIVTLGEAKDHLRRSGCDDEDDYIEGLIASVVSHLDGPRGVLGRCILSQRWQWDTEWRGGELRLPLPDASEIEAVRVDDQDAETPVTFIAAACGPFSSVRFPALDRGPVRLRFRAQLPEDARAAVRQAMLLTIGHLYLNRESVVTGTIATKLPLAATTLLAPLRVRWIA